MDDGKIRIDFQIVKFHLDAGYLPENAHFSPVITFYMSFKYNYKLSTTIGDKKIRGSTQVNQ